MGEVMLRSTTESSRLYLTAELLAADALPLPKKATSLFKTEMKRFPPVEDVVLALDRIASRAFAA